MVPLPAKARGATLAEIIISAALLLAVSALFFGSIIPLVQKSNWFAGKQTSTRGFLVAKERIGAELRNAQLLDTAPFSSGSDTVLLQFIKPQRSETDYGDLAVIDFREISTFDSTHVDQIVMSDTGLLRVDYYSGEKNVLWNLGPGYFSNTVVIRPDKRGVELTFRGQTPQTHSTKSDWEYRIVAFTD